MYKLKKTFYSFIALFVEFFSKLRKLDSNLIIFNSSSNSTFNFNSKFLFQYYVENHSEFNVYFVINDKSLMIKLINEYGNYFISTHTLKGIITASRAKTWIASAFITPYIILPIISNKKRIIYHIGHGVPLKKIGLAEEKITFLQYINRFIRTRAFTHVLSFSTSFNQIMQEGFQNNKIQYVHLGQPRNDQFSKTKAEILPLIQKNYPQIQSFNQLILYAPTWRNYAKTIFFPFPDNNADELNDILKQNEIFLLLRAHPLFPFDIASEFLNKSNILLFSNDLVAEIMDYLPIFNKLITDYSSIYLDFLCINRPIAFIPYDIQKYIKITGFNLDYEEVTPGDKITTFGEFVSFLISDQDSFCEERKQLAKKVNAKSNGNCEENFHFISNIINASNLK